MAYRKVLAEIVADNTKAQNTDFLAADFQVTRSDSLVHISWSERNKRQLFLVPSEGSSMKLPLVVLTDEITSLTVALDTGRTWNIQTDNASGTLIPFLRIVEIGE